MIKEERLKELMLMKAIIWRIENEKVIDFEYNNFINFYGQDDLFLKCVRETLFETREQAEWYLKTHIEKTVKAPEIPMWEELDKDLHIHIGSFNQEGNMLLLDIRYKCIFIYKTQEVVYSDKLTKQNYIKAVDKFLELWREE